MLKRTAKLMFVVLGMAPTYSLAIDTKLVEAAKEEIAHCLNTVENEVDDALCFSRSAADYGGPQHFGWEVEELAWTQLLSEKSLNENVVLTLQLLQHQVCDQIEQIMKPEGVGLNVANASSYCHARLAADVFLALP